MRKKQSERKERLENIKYDKACVLAWSGDDDELDVVENGEDDVVPMDVGVIVETVVNVDDEAGVDEGDVVVEEDVTIVSRAIKDS